MGVVVGGQQPVPVLDQVGPEQEPVPVRHHAVEVEEEIALAAQASGSRSCSEKGDEPPSFARHPVDVEVEVSYHGVDEQSRVFVGQRGGGVPSVPSLTSSGT